MNSVTYGCEITIEQTQPTQHWFASRSGRDDAVKSASRDFRRAADNRVLRVRNLVRVAEVVYAEVGPDALHEQWRPTLFRASHRKRLAYMDQCAIVDVMSGKVVVADAQEPFQPAQYWEWNRDLALEEIVPSLPGVRESVSFWPTVRPARPNEDCHYVVVRLEDCIRLRNLSKPACHPVRMTRLDTQAA